MTTTARELFEEWYSMCSFNSGDTKYACSEAWRQAFERGRESVLSKLPAISEYMDKGLELDAQQRAEDPMAHYVEVSRLHYEWLLAKLKEPT